MALGQFLCFHGFCNNQLNIITIGRRIISIGIWDSPTKIQIRRDSTWLQCYRKEAKKQKILAWQSHDLPYLLPGYDSNPIASIL
jgi:hypothetical protein